MSSSLKAISSPLALEPAPVVVRSRSRTVTNGDSITLVVRRCFHCFELRRFGWMGRSYCQMLWIGESARIDHRKLFNQARPNQGRPPDHQRVAGRMTPLSE